MLFENLLHQCSPSRPACQENIAGLCRENLRQTTSYQPENQPARNSPEPGIVSKLVRNDAGGDADRSGDIIQVGPQLFDEGLLAAGARQQPAVGREGVERAEES